MGCDGLVVEVWLGRGTTALHCTRHVLTHRLKDLSLFLFPSLPGPVVGEMQPGMLPWAWLAGHSPTSSGVRDQHRYHPSASSAREGSGSCRGRSSSLSEIMQIVTAAVRVIYLACVQCRGTLHRAVLHPGVPVMWHAHIRDLSPTAEGCKVERLFQGNKLPWLIVSTGDGL